MADNNLSLLDKLRAALFGSNSSDELAKAEGSAAAELKRAEQAVGALNIRLADPMTSSADRLRLNQELLIEASHLQDAMLLRSSLADKRASVEQAAEATRKAAAYTAAKALNASTAKALPAAYQKAADALLDLMQRSAEAQLAAEQATPPEGQEIVVPAELQARGTKASAECLDEDTVSLWCDADGDGAPLDAAFQSDVAPAGWRGDFECGTRVSGQSAIDCIRREYARTRTAPHRAARFPVPLICAIRIPTFDGSSWLIEFPEHHTPDAAEALDLIRAARAKLASAGAAQPQEPVAPVVTYVPVSPMPAVPRRSEGPGTRARIPSHWNAQEGVL